MNVVSDRFVQRANAAICTSLRPSPSRTTATGFPRYGSAVNTSTWRKLRGLKRTHPWAIQRHRRAALSWLSPSLVRRRAHRSRPRQAARHTHYSDVVVSRAVRPRLRDCHHGRYSPRGRCGGMAAQRRSRRVAHDPPPALRRLDLPEGKGRSWRTTPADGGTRGRGRDGDPRTSRRPSCHTRVQGARQGPDETSELLVRTGDRTRRYDGVRTEPRGRRGALGTRPRCVQP